MIQDRSPLLSIPPNEQFPLYKTSLSARANDSSPVDVSTFKKRTSLRNLKIPLNPLYPHDLVFPINKTFPKEKQDMRLSWQRPFQPFKEKGTLKNIETIDKIIQVGTKQFQTMLENHNLPLLPQADIEQLIRHSITANSGSQQQDTPTFNNLKKINFHYHENPKTPTTVYVFKKTKNKIITSTVRHGRHLRMAIESPVNILNPEKSLRIVKIDRGASLNTMEKEFDSLFQLQNIPYAYPPPYIDTNKKKQLKVYHLFPHYNFPDLFQYIHHIRHSKESCLKQKKTWIIAIKLAKKLNALHSNKRYHGNIKPDNILLHIQSSRHPSTKNISLMFGDINPPNQENIPRFWTPIYAPIEWHQNQRQEPLSETIHPENQLDPSADIWQLGCLFFELFTEQKLPWDMNNKSSIPMYLEDLTLEHVKALKTHLDNLSPNEMPPELRKLILRMLDPSRHYRPKIEEVGLQLEKIYREKFLGVPFRSFSLPSKK